MRLHKLPIIQERKNGISRGGVKQVKTKGGIVTKQIELTQGKVAIVSDEDFERISTHRWFAHKDSKSGKFSARRHGRVLLLRTTVLMHREITNAPGGLEVDHINGNTLDNRRSNLRVCVRSENGCNTRKPVNNTSGFKGVSRYRNSWRAKIKTRGRTIHLGIYAAPEAAARAYDVAARKYFGEYASTNFTM